MLPFFQLTNTKFKYDDVGLLTTNCIRARGLHVTYFLVIGLFSSRQQDFDRRISAQSQANSISTEGFLQQSYYCQDLHTG